MTIALPRPWRRMPRQGRQAGPAWTLVRPWTRRALVHRLVENPRAGFPQRPLASSSAGRRRQPNGCHDVNQASHTEFLTVPAALPKAPSGFWLLSSASSIDIRPIPPVCWKSDVVRAGSCPSPPPSPPSRRSGDAARADDELTLYITRLTQHAGSGGPGPLCPSRDRPCTRRSCGARDIAGERLDRGQHNGLLEVERAHPGRRPGR